MTAESFDDLFTWHPVDGNIRYGTDVLAGLLDGIESFLLECRSPTRGRPRTPVLLGSALWIDDAPLLAVLQKFAGVCITVQKQKRSTEHLASGTDISGAPARALPYLRTLRPAVDGEPEVIGPSDGPLDDLLIGPFRAFGTRRTGSKQVPILHAKLLILGHTWWYEDDFGSENQAFTPCRLWISSANFTAASRRSLEFGLWTTETQLMKSALNFLEIVMAHSEPIDPVDGTWSPELMEPDLDGDAFAEVAYEARLAAEESQFFESLGNE